MNSVVDEVTTITIYVYTIMKIREPHSSYQGQQRKWGAKNHMSTWDTLIALKLAACIAWKGQKYDYDGYEGAGRWWCGHFTGFDCGKKKHL